MQTLTPQLLLICLSLAASTTQAAPGSSSVQRVAQVANSTVGVPNQTVTAPSSHPQAVSLDSLRQLHEANIAALTLERGAFGPGLDEAYHSYGRTLLDNGHPAEAADVLRQAWQLSRMQTGLISESQLHHLTALIQALIELQRWSEVHDLHQLRFLIASQAYPPDDVRYLLAAEFFGSWQWETISGRLDSMGSRQAFALAQSLSAFYTEVLDSAERHGNEHTQQLLSLLLGKAHTDITLARALAQSRISAPAIIERDSPYDSTCIPRIGESAAISGCSRAQFRGASLFDGGAGGPISVGHYLGQIDHTIAVLERLTERPDVDANERAWIGALISRLRREAQVIVESVRRN